MEDNRSVESIKLVLPCLDLVGLEEDPRRRKARSIIRTVELGRGSYGVVYLAYKPEEDGKYEEIAVKTTTMDKAQWVVKEHRILEALKGCPEIVRCHGHGISVEGCQSLYNVLLEYASAGTLFDLILRSHGLGLPEPHVRRFAGMILTGLDYMHARGFVHCDIKPENILAFADQDGSHFLKIADFGVTMEPHERQSRETQRGWFRGTAEFMSPESVKVGVIVPALDIWSLGCVVVQMITGHSHWHGRVKEFDAGFMSGALSPNVPHNLSGQGKDFLQKCFRRSYRTRWTAHMLLHHPFVSTSLHH